MRGQDKNKVKTKTRKGGGGVKKSSAPRKNVARKGIYLDAVNTNPSTPIRPGNPNCSNGEVAAIPSRAQSTTVPAPPAIEQSTDSLQESDAQSEASSQDAVDEVRNYSAQVSGSGSGSEEGVTERSGQSESEVPQADSTPPLIGKASAENKPPRGRKSFGKNKKSALQLRQMVPFASASNNTATLVVDAMNTVGTLISDNTKVVHVNNTLLRDVFNEVAAFRHEEEERATHSKVHNTAMQQEQQKLLEKCVQACEVQPQRSAPSLDLKWVSASIRHHWTQLHSFDLY